MLVEDFPSFEKIPRLHRPVVVTEKIDGTNALVSITRETWGNWMSSEDPTAIVVQDVSETDEDSGYPTHQWAIRAGSREQWLTLDDDNKGFCAWVHKHAGDLVQLGVGNHYGEWWGQGIGRGYGLTERRFSLFNVRRWAETRPACCDVMPVIARGNGESLNEMVNLALLDLDVGGSWAAPGFSDPEGVVVYHEDADVLFKVTLGGDRKKTPKLAVRRRMATARAVDRAMAGMLKPPGMAQFISEKVSA